MHKSDKMERRIFALALFIVVAVVLFAVVLGYRVRCYSDPANWLRYSRDLAEGIRSTKWPVVYPFFLWCAEHVTGPFAIFLVNLPLLAGFAACLGFVLKHCCRDGEQPSVHGRWVALTFVALAMAFDWPLVYNLINPYRDPLALLFRAAGVLCFFLALARERMQGIPCMAGAGLLIGLSIATREPGVLMLLPLFAFALVAGRKRNFSWLLSYGAAFVFGLVVGAMPLMVQTLVKTGTLGPPPQSVADGELIPGIRLRQFVHTGRNVFHYFVHDHWWVSILALVSLPLAVVRKRWAFLWLVAAPTLIYLLFYSCYYTFVARYVFYASVGVAGMAAFALHEGAAVLCRGDAWHRWRVHALLSVLIVGAACVVVVRQIPREPRRGIREAKAFAQWVRAEVSGRDVVLCARPVSEFVEILGRREVSRPWRMVDSKGYIDREVMRGELARLQAAYARVFLAECPDDRENQALVETVRLFYDVVPVASLPVDRFNSAEAMGDGDLVLYRVEPWQSKNSRVWVDPDSSDRGSVVFLFLGDISGEHVPSQSLRLRMGDQEYPLSTDGGVVCLRLVREVPVEELAAATVESDGVLPAQVMARLVSPDQGMQMELGMGAGWMYTEGLAEADMRVWEDDIRVVEARDNNVFWVPEIGEAGDLIEVSLCLNSTILNPAWWPRMSVARGDRNLWNDVVPETAGYRWIRFWFESTGGAEFLKIATHSRQPGRGIEPVRILIDKASVRVLPSPSDDMSLCWTAADVDESPLRVDEIHATEKGPEGISVAWTTGRTRVLVPVQASDAYRCRLKYTVEALPPKVPGDVNLSWNGVSVRVVEDRRAGVTRELVTELLRGTSLGEYGVLELRSMRWQPSDYLDSQDNRMLGVRLIEISFERVPPASALDKGERRIAQQD